MRLLSIRQRSPSSPPLIAEGKGAQNLLANGLPRVRYYGLLANKSRATLARCRQLLAGPTEAEPLTEGVDQPPATRAPAADSHQAACCPACGHGRLNPGCATRTREISAPVRAGLPHANARARRT